MTTPLPGAFIPAIPPRKTALLVIDMQLNFLQPDGYAARAGLDIAPLHGAIAPVAAVLAAARAAGLLIEASMAMISVEGGIFGELATAAALVARLSA